MTGVHREKPWELPGLGNGLKRIASDYVADARAGGATWREMGPACGVTAQSAHRPFGPNLADHDDLPA